MPLLQERINAEGEIMTDAYPLKWPSGWPRSNNPRRASFSEKTLARVEAELMQELGRLKATRIVITSNIVRSAQPPDRGVSVYFTKDGKEQCIPCDKWDRVEHNVWAIFKTVEALRGIERWGAKEMVDAAFRGFTALPAPEDMRPIKTPREIIGVSPDMNDPDYISFKYKQKAKELHPDQNETDGKAMAELNDAFDKLKKELEMK